MTKISYLLIKVLFADSQDIKKDNNQNLHSTSKITRLLHMKLIEFYILYNSLHTLSYATSILDWNALRGRITKQKDEY